MKKANGFGFWRLILGVALLLLSLLFIFAVSVDLATLINDYSLLRDAQLNFINILKLDLPVVENPIGPFGVFFGFWLIFIFGKFLSLSLLLTTALLGLFSLFFYKDKSILGKIFSFLFFSFFFNLVLFSLWQKSTVHAGLIPWHVFQFMLKVFGNAGALIISLIVVITNLVIIFEIENVKKFFLLILKIILGFFKLLLLPLKKGNNVKTKNKPPRTKKERTPIKPKFLSENKEKSLNIVDHTNMEDSSRDFSDNTDKNRQPKFKKVVPVQETERVDAEEKPEYRKPGIDDFLESTLTTKRDRDEIEANIREVSKILEKKLAEFGVDAEVMNVNIGPIITQYEIKPAPGVKVNKFQSLADDLALAIKATSIRVQAPIPGRGLVGIEIPNIKRDIIYLKDILLSQSMTSINSPLAIGLGKDIAGNPIVADLGQMPHLLIAGATGSGKSVCINTIISCFLFRTTPEEVRFILIDPKRIELSGFEGIPHLIQNVVTNNDDALTALNWGVSEMERRYDLLQKYKVKNLKAYNEKIIKMQNKDEELEDAILPHIIIIVDELADLMMTVGREVERPITRLAQMARAIGLHLILATQRPSIKVITGIIKANFPSRIAFKVSTKIDSRVIIDVNGAEKLLGMGDMLFLAPGKGNTERIHGAYIPPNEVHNLVDYLKTQPKPEQEITIISDEESLVEDFEYDDELFPEAAVAVVTANTASVSMLQRHFKIGYARAGRLIDMLERAGIIGPHVGSKSREVISTEEDMKIYGFIPDR